MRWALLVAALIPVATCQRSSERPFSILLVANAAKPADAYLEIRGIDSALVRDAAGRERTLQVFAVRADGATQPEPVAGRYADAGDAIRFKPLYPFDPGRSY